jgi:DNA-binding NarL/FixJ family response regulator
LVPQLPAGQAHNRFPERIKAAKAKLLTPAQVSVMDLICLGKTNEEIGAILHRSPLTVKNHVQEIIHKLDANNRTYAAVLYTVKKIKDAI